MVSVISKTGKVLMPTSKHGKVKWLLRTGKAVIDKYEPFTIRLTYATTEYTQEVVLGVDAGSIHVGVSVVNVAENKELYSEEAILRTDIQDLLSDKRQNRRARRNNLRYRKPRFNNRKKPEGWLAPSIEHKIESHLKIIRNIMQSFPVSKIVIETASFDLQKILNDNISGKEYQEGDMRGFWNTREYVMFRDNHTCQCCHGKSKDKILNVHHIESRKTGGNSPANLITLCETCHSKYHKNLLDIKFGKRSKSLRHETHMGIMRWAIYNRLKEECEKLGIKVEFTYGYITKNTRITAGLLKSHRVDARCITRYPTAKPVSEYNFSKFVRKCNRSLHKVNLLKGGVKKANKAPYLVHGFRLFDKVEYNNQVGFIFGRRASGYFDIRDLEGNSIHKSAKYKDLKILQYSNTKLTEKRRLQESV